MTPIEILCQWAWAKVDLEAKQREANPTLVQAAIVAFRHALRKKKQLDLEYHDHHLSLMKQEQDPQQLLPL